MASGAKPIWGNVRAAEAGCVNFVAFFASLRHRPRRARGLFARRGRRPRVRIAVSTERRTARKMNFLTRAPRARTNAVALASPPVRNVSFELFWPGPVGNFGSRIAGRKPSPSGEIGIPRVGELDVGRRDSKAGSLYRASARQPWRRKIRLAARFFDPAKSTRPIYKYHNCHIHLVFFIYRSQLQAIATASKLCKPNFPEPSRQ